MMPQPHAWLEINIAQFSQNLQAAQRLIGNSKLCAVMKADAYGLGIRHLLPTAATHQLPYIAIADNTEAQTIRAYPSVYQGKILRIRTASHDEISAAIPYQVEEIVGHLDNARIMSTCAIQAQVSIPFHLKLNSAGMGRNGLDLQTSEGRQQALEILRLPGLSIVGIMTHFPKEEPQDITDSLLRFNKECAWLITQGKLDRDKLCLHSANSYATLANSDTHLDMVRVGSLIYGDGFMPDFEGFPHILTFKSRIASINTYMKGSSISYEREHVLTRDSRIATVLVGYADGYRRIFSHHGSMLVRHRYAPVIGRVSMNVTTLDVTDIPDAVIGDEVVIFGQQGQAEITQEMMEQINQALFADLYTVWGKCNPVLVV